MKIARIVFAMYITVDERHKKEGADMHFGMRVQKIRKERGMSLRQLAAASGVDRGLISLIERGKRPQVSVPVAKKLAQALGVTLDYLAGMYADEDVEDEAPAFVEAGVA